MKMGTKSVLFGSHQFLIHPWFVAWGWWKLYGFPWDPRLWVCFFVHDLGYLGKPNMDGEEGEQHVRLGANIAHWMFDELAGTRPFRSKYWYQMCFYHSRYWARKYGALPSKLCYADKLAFVITPFWVYLPLACMTGEWKEYSVSHPDQYERTLLGWYKEARGYCRAWVMEHYKGDKEDTWTKLRNNT